MSYVPKSCFEIGFLGNFHFYPLIADKVSKNIHADKPNIYVGVNLDTGITFTFYKTNQTGQYHSFSMEHITVFGTISCRTLG